MAIGRRATGVHITKAGGTRVRPRGRIETRRERGAEASVSPASEENV